MLINELSLLETRYLAMQKRYMTFSLMKFTIKVLVAYFKAIA